MSGAIRFNPGNLHVRLGATLQLYEAAAYAGDLEKASTMLGLIETYCGVHMTEAQRRTLRGMPTFAYNDSRQPHEVFHDMNARLAYVFDLVKHHGVFSRAAPETGDASSLDDEETEAEEIAA